MSILQKSLELGEWHGLFFLSERDISFSKDNSLNMQIIKQLLLVLENVHADL